MMAVASFTFSTEAFTWLSHSGWSGWPSRSMRLRVRGPTGTRDCRDLHSGTRCSAVCKLAASQCDVSAEPDITPEFPPHPFPGDKA